MQIEVLPRNLKSSDLHPSWLKVIYNVIISSEDPVGTCRIKLIDICLVRDSKCFYKVSWFNNTIILNLTWYHTKPLDLLNRKTHLLFIKMRMRSIYLLRQKQLFCRKYLSDFLLWQLFVVTKRVKQKWIQNLSSSFSLNQDK